MHIDMDAFFASVEQNDNPELRGKPVIIGADPCNGTGRGVVSTCSYEARKFGIRSAMPISRAWKLCPNGIFISPRMERYTEISEQVFDIFQQFTPDVEILGIDEAFLDCTGCSSLWGDPYTMAKKIKMRICNDIGITASIGIAANKSIAKIASDMNKPNGITFCKSGEEAEFLSLLPVGKLWGAGPKTVERLYSIGIRTIGDLALTSEQLLVSIFGETGNHLYQLSHGIDNRPVDSISSLRKSISEEITFMTDTDDIERIHFEILRMSDNVSHQMRKESFLGRTVSLKIRLEGFDTFTRQSTLSKPFSGMKTLKDESLSLFNKFDRDSKKIRLIGVGVSGLIKKSEYTEDLFLFDDAIIKDTRCDELLDALKDRFGNCISRASLLRKTD